MAYSGFLIAGFPIITFFFIAFFVYHMITDIKQKCGGINPVYNGGFKTAIASGALLFMSIFLIFGPYHMRQLAIHMILLSIVAFHSTCIQSKWGTQFVIYFGALTFMCMIGSMGIMGYTQNISTMTSGGCNSYYGKIVNLCKDTGYLMFLRVVGAFAIYTVGFLLLSVFGDVLVLNNTSLETSLLKSGERYQAYSADAVASSEQSTDYKAATVDEDIKIVF